MGDQQGPAPGSVSGGDQAESDDARSLTDLEVEVAIRNELLLDHGVDARSIDVEVEDGIVTLSGNANDLLDKRRAVELAEYIRGVRAVVDRISVPPSTRSDDEIEADVRTALLMDSATDLYEIEVSVQDGHVKLTGNVDSWQESDIAEHVAAGVVGVTGIDNALLVIYASDRPEAEISADVIRQLTIDTRVDAGLIDVKVDGDAVTLSGTVGSASEKRIAHSDAWVAGVRSVDVEDLKVQWWARDPGRREAPVALSDAEIARAVTDAFVYDPRVSSLNPTVLVDAGSVTLIGEVDSMAAKAAAEDDAEHTAGVWRVRNLLDVEPAEEVDDAELKSRVETMLRFSVYVADDDLDVSVRGGRVRLDGQVDSTYESAEAARIAGSVAGVREVDNSLEVLPSWIGYNDWELREDLRNRLLWDTRVDDADLSVSVEAGIATITGEVQDWPALRAIQDNARRLGIHEVVLDVQVRDGGPEAMRTK